MGKTYKNLQEMMDSPEYKELILKVYMGVKEGFVDVYPPLPGGGMTAWLDEATLPSLLGCDMLEATGE